MAAAQESGIGDTREDEKAEAEKLRSATVESAHWLRGEVSRLWDGYQRQPRFARMRANIVIAFAVLAAVSVFMAAPTPNRIGAHPRLVRSPDRTGWIVSVENLSKAPWTNVVFELDDGAYQYPPGPALPIVAPGVPYGVEVPRFATAGSLPGTGQPPPGYRPKAVHVRCDQGDLRAELFE